MTGGKFLSYIMEGTFFIPQCYHHNTQSQNVVGLFFVRVRD